jgi:flavin-dependent dehydrogenase
MSDAEAIRRNQLRDPANWLEQARQTEHTWARLRRAEPLMRPFTHAAYTQALDPVTGTGWLAVGDASSTFDPLSAQGIYKALNSGIFASYAILDWFKVQPAALERYAALQNAGFKQYFVTWKDYYAREQRWPESHFWKHRHNLRLEESYRPDLTLGETT